VTEEIQDSTETPETALTGTIVPTAEGSQEVKAQMLKENEQIIKRNWAKATEKVENVYRALTLIHTHDLWKLHKDEKGKRKYTAFDQYLFGEFGWELSRVRALQIIKAQRAKMIEAGELPEDAATPRKRTAPEVTTEKAAKVTADQLDKVLEAFGTRVANIDEGDPDRPQIVNLYNEAYETIGSYIRDLREMVSRIEAEAGQDAADAKESEPTPAVAV
jgi:hypothetical protein